MSEYAWSLRDIHFQHTGAPRPSLDGISLDLRAARMTALLGPNGAGKSTLLQVMLGTLHAGRGEVTFRNRPMPEWSRTELAKVVGVVPQTETEPMFTVREIVAMGRYPHLGPWRREREGDTHAIQSAMQRCGVEEFADRWLTTLSGGERQRVRIARALAQEPSVIVLDEPTVSLDVRYEMTTFELLHQLRDDGVTVILATHNLNLAARYADELVLLHHGRTAAHGTPAQVLTAERVSAVYEWPVTVTRHESGAPQILPRSGADDGAHVSEQRRLWLEGTGT